MVLSFFIIHAVFFLPTQEKWALTQFILPFYSITYDQGNARFFLDGNAAKPKKGPLQMALQWPLDNADGIDIKI